MTKRDLVIRISDQTGLSQVDVKKVVDLTLQGIIDALAEGKKVELRNFGVFKVKTRKQRTGRNPRTGDTVPIPSKRVVHFKVGKVLKDKV